MTHLDITQGIARLTLESPPVNALSEKLLNSIGQALDSLELRDDWSVLTLASSAGAFCAGGDLHAMAGWMQQSGPERAIGAYAQSVQRIAARIEALPQVTIALCERSALGGGLELALACDLRVASSRAKFGLPEVRLGLLPGAGGTQRLTRLCGVPAALRLILGAEIVDADMARQFGLVQWVFKADCFEKEAQRLAARYAAMPRQAQQASKSCIRLAHERHAGFQHEIEALSTLCATQETRHLVEDFLAGAREGGERK